MNTLMRNPEFNNEKLNLAFEFVQFTGRNIFLTGKAGTGKTTFLHNLKKNTSKRMVVLAPTGVAAINAGGVTIHSFFQLPLGPYVPGYSNVISYGENIAADKGRRMNQPLKYNINKINVIKSLDLLVIDEISMVRADILDAVDDALRFYRNSQEPFGGVQLLLIGDLYQLSPVVKEAEWQLLREHYDNAYFFSSKALLKSEYFCIELEEIFRQQDSEFIEILNKIRNNDADSSVLKKLNSRYNPDFIPDSRQGFVTLTTHNAIAAGINQKQLDRLKGEASSFDAVVEGDFQEYSYPAELKLILKTGSQVMFVKNDSSPLKQYYNGKLGVVTDIDAETVSVECENESGLIVVGREEWNNIRYEIDVETKELREIVIGRFSQIPLKLAWAITIHKSQGLTFEKAIIDTKSSFAHGQVYVALSRCKSLDGLTLRTPVYSGSIKTDFIVSDYTYRQVKNQPDLTILNEMKCKFQKSLIYELFDFTGIEQSFTKYRLFLKDNNNNIINESLLEASKYESVFDKILNSLTLFRNELGGLTAEGFLPEENARLQERVMKASAWFISEINWLLEQFVYYISIETDNKNINKQSKSLTDKLQFEMILKRNCLQASLNGFNTLACCKARTNTGLGFKPHYNKKVSAGAADMRSDFNISLYGRLLEFRNYIASECNIEGYRILPLKTISEITKKQPATMEQLLAVKGIGKRKIKLYGEKILSIVSQCITEKDYSDF